MNYWEVIQEHHFTPQTSESFDTKILNSKCINCYDIENIDYKYIEKLYNTTIPESILQQKQGHERGKYDITINKYVYNLYMITYLNSNVDMKYFYNEELKKKLFEFYKKDFIFFNNMGLDYINTTF